ncbi:MAG: zinc-dependent peptidase [Azoarcus sp. PHD]|nr:MAG: zinc-dependent peptidase [Azoarcus sp. PHD]
MLKRIKEWLGLESPRPVVPNELWDRIESGLPFLAFLTVSDRLRLRELALAFLADKEFHGAQGLELTDEILLGIALQASLPVLNIGLEAYHGWVGIIVYPGGFVIPRHEVDEAGVVHSYDDEVLGEAWAGGPVLVSWFGGHHPIGVNVVIHEFAHKLDMANGEADGFPALPARMSRRDWAAAFTPAYEKLCAQVDADEMTALDPYGSENPGEFFAVASEAFFETPGQLLDAFPAVYDQLKSYYGLDPAAGEAGLRAEPDLHRGAT